MVLITGGGLATNINNSPVLATAELYNPATGTFAYTGSLNNARSAHTATLLNNGMVLITGGGLPYNINSPVLASAELYLPTTLTPANLLSIAVTPATVMLSPRTTQQFIATGTFSDGSIQQLASVTWSSSDTTTTTISNDATNRGTAIVVGSPSSLTPITITATDGTVSGSATLNVGP